MRKYNFILMAFALLLGMAQCKKESTIPNGDNNEGVRITLKVDDGPSTGSGTDNGEKLNVYPATGAVIFTQGDKIYVGNNGKYVGTLTFDNGLFQGTINDDLCSTTDYLHFYFVGNKPTSPANLTASTTTYTVNISDQSTGLPAISYAPSTAKYSPSTTAYTAKLLNKSGLVKFVTSLPTDQSITISGMNNEVKIDFANNMLAPTNNTGGITLYSESTTEKWAILLPQAAVTSAEVTGSGFSAPNISVPAINDNFYNNVGIGITITNLCPTGAICGLFSKSATKKVYFSQGNLQYNKTTNEWSFMEHQYDMVETDLQDVGFNYANQNIISLFGWGTSGNNHGAVCYQPWSISATENQYYAYGDAQYNLNDLTGQADWGCNTIANGSTLVSWRTLTKPEFYYLLHERSTTSGIRWAKGKVNSVNGLILLPDTWTASIYTLNNTNDGACDYNNNIITAEVWTSTFEANGAVFLPAAGWRYEAGAHNGGNGQVAGQYWTSTKYNNVNAYRVVFNDTFVSNTQETYANRNYGFSVRLVCDAE
ncbi:MAG: hypothetical protein IJL04_00270 [Bacteroidales bacterium]|nr:hypothetical protein [Bacteroidales bacterium]MBQ6100708.1 hypothetical protein [Bacteroidales bacterium]